MIFLNSDLLIIKIQIVIVPIKKHFYVILTHWCTKLIRADHNKTAI